MSAPNPNTLGTELSMLDRVEALAQAVKVAQSAPLVPATSNSRERGFRHLCRIHNLERTGVARAIAIAGLAPDAKAAARLSGIDNNASALLSAAKQPPDEQARYLAKSGGP